MRDIRIAVVEDDPTSCQQVLDHLNRYQEERNRRCTVSVFTDGSDIVERYTPIYDILLLDIEMRTLNGMEAAKIIRKQDSGVSIIFITAAPQYAISGYEVGALSYLLKPVPYFAFSQEIDRSIRAIEHNDSAAILVETGQRRTRLNLADILYIESIRHTIILHLSNERINITGTLKTWEAELGGANFFRCNSCYLVNLRHVQGVEDQDCLLSNGTQLRISRPRKKAFMNALTEYLGGIRA